jgi:lysine 6-dehydrogenase
MRYVVLGAGQMGSAVASDLAVTEEGATVFLADIDLEIASRSASALGERVTPLALDFRDFQAVRKILSGSDAAVGAASYTVNPLLTRAAIAGGVHLVDLGGNNDIVREQIGYDSLAKSAGVTVVPNAGLAPGLINILAMAGLQELDEVDEVHLRVGGLPQDPSGPLKYQRVFSIEGLLNEYIEPAKVLRNGEITEIPSLSELEEIEFPSPFGTMEAFATSGGVSFLPELLRGKVQNCDYKTIRYPGHCERFKTLLELGFAENEPLLLGDQLRTSREFFTDLLRKRLPAGGRDVVLARATLTGRLRQKSVALVYELIDRFDDRLGMTAMMRTTAFPVAIIARMLAGGTIASRGVLLPEACVPATRMIEELAKRQILITKGITEIRP